MMLKYMYENYGDKFEWFMRADDDVFVKTERLEIFLKNINSSQPRFIGQAGKGIAVIIELQIEFISFLGHLKKTKKQCS